MKAPIIGRKVNEVAIDSLIDALEKTADAEAVLYVGYPVAATADEAITIPALLTSPKHGLIAFDVRASIKAEDVPEVQQRQDEIVLAIKAKLLQHRSLTKGSDLAIPINILTYCPEIPTTKGFSTLSVASATTLSNALDRSKTFGPDYLKPLNAAIERVANIRPKVKRPNAKTAESRGSILKTIEGEIANLDSWQKSAAIEIPDGPQRIRGLAGSGKTIVLALKAAYLHGQHSDWRIIVTFHTRALRQQFKNLIRRFYFEDYREEPDWDALRVIHSFGSIGEPGVYSEVCQAHGQYPRNFLETTRLDVAGCRMFRLEVAPVFPGQRASISDL
jgi:superfamily I DNA and RNA helicase